MAHTSSVEVGVIGSRDSDLLGALEGTGNRFHWAFGREAWKAGVLLWIVDASEGIPEGTRERFRTALEAGDAPAAIVYLEGTDRVVSPIPEILELAARDLLEDLGLKAESVRVLRGTVQELASALLKAQTQEERERAYGSYAVEVSPPTRGDDGRTHKSLEAAEETPDAWIVPVFYGTDRDRTKSQEPAKIFGTGRGPLSFGYAEVSLPKRRDKGEMPTPTWWKPL